MRKTVSVITRIAGEMEIAITTAPDGKITKVLLHPYSSVRGFETLVKGRGFTFVVPAVMRICGVCHAVQGAAICDSIEEALGIQPPREGMLLREACILVNRLQSHFLQHFLVIPDLIPPSTRPQLQKVALDGLNQASMLLQIIGGTATHPFRLTVGGMTQGLTIKARDKTLEMIANLKDLTKSFSKEFTECIDKNPVAKQLAKLPFHSSYLATDPFYGNASRVNPDFIKAQEHAGNALPVTYNNQSVEVGPRARLSKFFGFSDNSLLGLQLARLQELRFAVERIEEILHVINLNAPVRSLEIPMREGKGIGVVEAPRGTLVHSAEIDAEGRVLDLKIFTPTQFNFTVLKEKLKGVPAQIAKTAIRIYDPCIPCVIH